MIKQKTHKTTNTATHHTRTNTNTHKTFKTNTKKAKTEKKMHLTFNIAINHVPVNLAAVNAAPS